MMLDSPTVMNAVLHTSWLASEVHAPLSTAMPALRLEGLLVVLLAFLNEAEGHATDMGCQIEAHTLFNQLKSFLALPMCVRLDLSYTPFLTQYNRMRLN